MIDARAVWLQQAPQQLANTTLPIGNEYFMLPRTLLSSAVWFLPWEPRRETTACVPCEEEASQLLSNILSASMCHVRDNISVVDDQSNPSDSPHRFVDMGKSLLLYLRQRWRYLSNRIFRLHTAYPVSLGCIAMRSPGSSMFGAETSP
jgi:hypothetical protein